MRAYLTNTAYFLLHFLVLADLLNVHSLSLPRTRILEQFPERTVELAVFMDQPLYYHWSSITYGPRASIESFIHSYLDVLLQSLNLIYAHPSLAEVPIGFHLAHSQIFWRGDPGNLRRGRVSAPRYLDAFCEFANRENWSGTRWDHALLLTGVDLKLPNGSNYTVAGISWDSSMCNKTYSCSIAGGKTFRSVITAAHEIGHSLGMEHDGLKYNSRCSPQSYIMSQSGGDHFGMLAWSVCSKQNLKAFLVAAPSVLSNQAECLTTTRWNVGSRSAFARHFRNPAWNGYGSGKNELRQNHAALPGHRFSLEEQCRLGGGTEWTPSKRRIHFKKMCSLLYCVNVVTKQTLPFHPALEGTYCGVDKVCHYGECVKNNARPKPLR